jgi:hypothetical protein
MPDEYRMPNGELLPTPLIGRRVVLGGPGFQSVVCSRRSQ